MRNERYRKNAISVRERHNERKNEVYSNPDVLLAYSRNNVTFKTCEAATYATIDEYIDLCCFAKKIGAHYVLMNPLSPFGRGVKTQQLAYTNNEMCLLKKQTELLATDNFQIVYIRFPNNEQKPIGKCPIGSVLYVFTNGDVAICPYMVFAANGENRYNAKDFILGNIFGNEELDLSTEIKKFIKHYLMQNTAYKNCGACSKGCYAIKISNDQDLSDCDFDICPLAGSKTK